MRKKIGLVALLAAGALILAGCGNSTNGAVESGDPSGTGTAETIVIGLTSSTATIEPWGNAGHPGQPIWGSVYDALTRIDNSGTVSPALAEKWENIDELSWEFTLKDGISFQNGEKLDAEAVAKTFNFLLSEEGRGEYSSHTSNYSYITEVTAKDEKTVLIKTSEPKPLLANDLTIVYIVPPALLESGIEELRANPSGTGPFKVESWDMETVELSPWDESWRATADVAGVRFVKIADEAARYQALQAGDIDVMVGLTPDQENRIKDNSDFGIYNEPFGRMISIKFIQNIGGPIEDAKVRRALNHAVNVTSINDNLLGSRGIESAWSPPGVNGHDPSRPGFDYNPDLAKQLLSEAGYSDGFTLVTEATMDMFDNDRQVYEAVAADLAKVGVKLDLQEIDFYADWLPKHTGAQNWVGAANTSVWTSAPQFDGLRPINFYASCDWVASTFCDPEMQEDIRAANVEMDLEKRNMYLSKVLDRMVENPPALLLFDLPQTWAFGPALSSFEVHWLNIDWSAMSTK